MEHCIQLTQWENMYGVSSFCNAEHLANLYRSKTINFCVNSVSVEVIIFRNAVWPSFGITTAAKVLPVQEQSEVQFDRVLAFDLVLQNPKS